MMTYLKNLTVVALLAISTSAMASYGVRTAPPPDGRPKPSPVYRTACEQALIIGGPGPSFEIEDYANRTALEILMYLTLDHPELSGVIRETSTTTKDRWRWIHLTGGYLISPAVGGAMFGKYRTGYQSAIKNYSQVYPEDPHYKYNEAYTHSERLVSMARSGMWSQAPSEIKERFASNLYEALMHTWSQVVLTANNAKKDPKTGRYILKIDTRLFPAEITDETHAEFKDFRGLDTRNHITLGRLTGVSGYQGHSSPELKAKTKEKFVQSIMILFPLIMQVRDRTTMSALQSKLGLTERYERYPDRAEFELHGRMLDMAQIERPELPSTAAKPPRIGKYTSAALSAPNPPIPSNPSKKIPTIPTTGMGLSNFKALIAMHSPDDQSAVDRARQVMNAADAAVEALLPKQNLNELAKVIPNRQNLDQRIPLLHEYFKGLGEKARKDLGDIVSLRKELLPYLKQSSTQLEKVVSFHQALPTDERDHLKDLEAEEANLLLQSILQVHNVFEIRYQEQVRWVSVLNNMGALSRQYLNEKAALLLEADKTAETLLETLKNESSNSRQVQP